MAPSNRLLLFHHEHDDLLGAMYDLSIRAKTRPQVRNFLTNTCAALQRQSAVVDGPGRTALGAFEDLLELADRSSRQQPPNAVAEMVLLATIQMGQLLV